jgi:hypothetical protein
MSVSNKEQVSIVGNSDETGYNTCGCPVPHKTVTEFVDCVLSKCGATATKAEPHYPNSQAVGLANGYVEILEPQWRMSKPQALAHAAWIVAVVGDEDTFFEILGSLQGDPAGVKRA